MIYGSVCSGIEAASYRRFMAKVDRRSDDECWPWKAALHSSGYGKFCAGGHSGRTLLAHRVSFEAHNGGIPNGMFVCHSCDNRICVNPKHLWLGSAQANVSDMMRKGRFRGYDKSGEGNPSAKLTREQAMEIRRRALTGENQSLIASQFCVSRSLVSEIKRGHVWR